jgi:hypothetical protein
MEFLITMFGIWIGCFLLYAFIGFIVSAIYLLWAVSLTRVFKKIGEDYWKAYIPFYNIYIMVRAAELNDLYILGCLLPLFGRLGYAAFYVYLIYISVMVAKKFGKQKKFLIRIVQASPLYMYELGKDVSIYKGNYNKKEKKKK